MCVMTRFVMENRMRMKRTYLGFALQLLLITSAFADTAPVALDVQKQPRTLGQKAVLHVYYYAPDSLEITYVDSYLFKDEDACKTAMGQALQIAMPYAGQGDLVSAKCVGMEPPEVVRKHEGAPEPSKPQEST